MCADFTRVKESLVDKILEQGQKLRNAMVQSILQNDPMSSGIIYNSKIHNTPVNSATALQPNEDKKLLEAFLNGDYLTKDQEELALNTIRSMPVSDVCETTQRTLLSKCCCATCTAYSLNNLKCDLRRSPNCSNLPTILKFVDSLKVILQSISLNDFGNKKVNTKSSLNETYFVEYYIPEVFTKNIKRKSKTDSGLEGGHVRVCAKRTTNNVIHIKQTYIHSVCNLYNHNLEDYDITFLIKYKTRGQTKSQLLGISKLNLGVFKHAKNASCGKTLPIQLNEESPISVGTFKVTLQLGAGKLYFGQEFVDAVLFEKESEKESDVSEDEKLTNVSKVVENKSTDSVKPVIETPLVENFEGELLFGFLYISEANFLNLTPNSYILCQPYCQNDTSSSRVVFNTSDPLYNFCQTIPLLYEESLLLKLRENFMVIEFWEKQGQSDILFGSTRLPLHQFYLGYRNTIIFKHLKRNKLPIIGTDWWEPIYSIDHNELIGQVQVLTALGTEEQIRNLEIERGFRNNIVKAKFPIKTTPIKKTIDLRQPSNYFKDRTKINRKPAISSRRDVGVQSESIATKMDKHETDKGPNPPDMLASFLKILDQRQKPAVVENSTNTDNETKIPEPQIKHTSDLLDSLQNVLSTAPPKKVIEKPPHFKAQININSANQLPSRRKIKSKSKRLKNVKHEDNILPSTYVSFETLPGEPLQITSVFPKSTQPQWNFTCQVCLPMDLLTNDPKRLIFKVWKKSTNAVLQPNIQTDLVLGFAALDLSVLAVGLPNVQGWFNIIDFSGKCNGQINIHVIPLEKIDKMSCSISNKTEEIVPQEMEECNEILSRALKRKFTELDEITQRLRLRLSEVVSEDSEGSNDDITDEFEHDINNLCIEEDFDLINFEDEAKKMNQKLDTKDKSNSDASSVLSVQTDENLLQSSDKHLIEGKHRIDTLLEKLSLITAEASKPFTDRYVSGCSAVSNEGKDIEVIFKNLEQSSRPNITATNNYAPEKFQDFCDDSGANSGSNDTSFADSSRPNPVGQGTISEDKKV